MSIAGKTLIIPCVSTSLADCFAIDWIIESLGLHRLHVFNSEFVDPLVMVTDKITAAMELYGSSTSTFAVIQIRSNVLSRVQLAEELIAFAKTSEVAEIVLITSASAFLLSGTDLESLVDSRVRNFTELDLSGLSGTGLMKYMLKNAEVKVSGFVGFVSGMGFQETVQVSRGLAARVLCTNEEKLKTPLSIRMLDSMPHMGLSASRCL
jgi:predicted ATP-grasp superfamily ATP-dependent carboligase